MAIFTKRRNKETKMKCNIGVAMMNSKGNAKAKIKKIYLQFQKLWI